MGNSIRIKDSVITNIKRDGDLFSKVAKTVGVSPYSMPRILKNKDKRLTQKEVLILLSGHLNECEADLYDAK